MNLFRKLLLIMKMMAFLLLLAIHVGATGWTQTVTLSLKEANLTEAFSEIRKQTGYNFLYNDDWLKEARKVSITVNNVPLKEALDKCFEGQPFTYTIIEKTIALKRRENPSPPDGQSTIVIPPVDITGHVTNEQGQPLSGAYVISKKTGKGTTTDAKGFFRLNGLNAGDVFTVSYIGYKELNIKIGTITDFTLVMQVATNELDKVQIQAYGTTTQRLATGNIATVTAAEIERQPVMNPLAALQGQVPGLIVTQTSGYASAPFKVELRGRSVINPDLPSEPLYIIDGVPLTVINLGNGGAYGSGSTGIIQNGFTGPAGGQSPLFSINPNDIESISVLKDADATAIYGSRGANGVIIINTKRGKAGKTKFEVNAYQGVNMVTGRYALLNTQQYLKMRREAFKNDNIGMNNGNAYDLLSWDTTRYTDWQKALWGGRGHTTDVQATLSGGDKQTTFRIGGGYHRETNIMTVSGADQRASVQFNLTHKSLDQKLVASFTSSYSYAQSNLTNLAAAATLPPDAPAIFDARGNLNYLGWGVSNTTQRRRYPFANLMQPYTSNTGFLNSQLSIQYELLKGLVLSSSLGYSTTHNSQKQLFPIASQDPAFNPTGFSQFGNNNVVNALVEPQLEYTTVIGKGKLNAFVGASYQSVNSDGNTIVGFGYTNDNLLESVGNAPSKTANNISGEYKYSAFFGRINYSWDEKYILNLSARRDGSSLFGPGKQFSNFESVGAAWLFTQEGWFKNHLTFLSFGKIRGSYGTTGSDNIPSYQYLSQWSSQGLIPYQPGGPAGYIPISLFNPNLEWQVNKKLEGALDLAFFSDRLVFEIARYQNRCGNQLVPFSLASVTGFTSVTANLPAVVQNVGWESFLNYKFIQKPNFAWSARVNIGINRNKLISYPNLDQSPYASIFTIGEPLNIRRLLHVTGVDAQTGQYTFQDKNHNGVVDNNYNKGDNDLYDKNFSVDFEGGFSTEVQYHRFQINLFFQYRKQQLPSAIYNGFPGTINNQSVQTLNHWQQPNDIARFARYTTRGTNTDVLFNSYSDGIYGNGSYIRLKNLALSYDVPEKWIKKAGMNNLRVYARGENLFLISKYNGVDPDAPSLGALPPQKMFTAGIQFNF